MPAADATRPNAKADARLRGPNARLLRDADRSRNNMDWLGKIFGSRDEQQSEVYGGIEGGPAVSPSEAAMLGVEGLPTPTDGRAMALLAETIGVGETSVEKLARRRRRRDRGSGDRSAAARRGVEREDGRVRSSGMRSSASTRSRRRGSSRRRRRI